MSKYNRIFWFIFLVAVMVMIFLLSNQTASASSELSEYVESIVIIQLPLFHIRKWAHIFEFALLGFAAMGFFRNWKIVLPFCYLYACSDEMHQMFIEARSPQISDTFVDAIGFVFVIVVWIVIDLLKRKRQFILKKENEVKK